MAVSGFTPSVTSQLHRRIQIREERMRIRFNGVKRQVARGRMSAVKQQKLLER